MREERLRFLRQVTCSSGLRLHGDFHTAAKLLAEADQEDLAWCTVIDVH